MFQIRSPITLSSSSVNSSAQAAASCGCRSASVHAKRGEDAHAGRVEHGGGVLEGLDQPGLALGHQRVGLHRDAQHLGGHRVAAQVARAAVGRGVGEPHALDAARVVGGELLPLHAHARAPGGRTWRSGASSPAPISLPKPSPLPVISAKYASALAEPNGRLDAELLLLEHAHLVELHHGAHRRPEGDRVDAVLVADEVGVGAAPRGR